jgi:hypothetical protein
MVNSRQFLARTVASAMSGLMMVCGAKQFQIFALKSARIHGVAAVLEPLDPTSVNAYDYN